MPHSIAFYIHPGHQLLDLAGPLDTFQAANDAVGQQLYDLHILSRSGGEIPGSAHAMMRTTAVDGTICDTLIVVGGNIERMRYTGEVSAVMQLAADAARIASVCTGAFLLAEAGLLDGRRATTHWSCARRLQQTYPGIIVEPDRIFASDGNI